MTNHDLVLFPCHIDRHRRRLGIGLALARELAARALSCHGGQERRRARSSGRLLSAAGLAAASAVVDVTDAAAVRELVADTVARHGRIDYLFNNAGIGVVGDARDLSLDDWYAVLDTNLRGTVHGVAAVYPSWRSRLRPYREHRSLAGLVPSPGQISYTASKYAVVGLSDALRVEAKDLGVKVSVVCPGLIDTPLVRNIRPIRIDRQELLQLLPGSWTRSAAPARYCAAWSGTRHWSW